MILEGNSDEINYFMHQCTKRMTCKNCVLNTWCNDPKTLETNLVIKRTDRNDKKYKVKHGLYAALITEKGSDLITKGGSKNK